MVEEEVDIEHDWEWMTHHLYATITDGERLPQLRTLSKVVKAIVDGDEIEVWAKDSDKRGTSRFNKHYVDVLKLKFPDAKWHLAIPIQPSGMRLLCAKHNGNTYIVLAAKIPKK